MRYFDVMDIGYHVALEENKKSKHKNKSFG